MNIKATLVIDEDDKLLEVFEAEKAAGHNHRAPYTIKKTREGIVFNIDAKDPVALRATFNGISKLLCVYENMKDLK